MSIGRPERSNFKRSSPINPFKNRSTTFTGGDNRRLSPTRKGFPNNSQRKFNGFKDPANFASQGRVSDVSMHSVTPVKRQIFQDTNGSFGKPAAHPFKSQTPERKNPFQKFVPGSISSHCGNPFERKATNNSYTNPYDTKPVRVNPFADITSNVDNFKQPQFKPASAARSNPFVRSDTVPGVFTKPKNNPFAKTMIEKENQPFPAGGAPVPSFGYAAKHVNHISNQYKPSEASVPAVGAKKTKKELLAGVMDYFLHSSIENSASNEDVQEVELYHSVVKPLSDAFLSDIPVNDSFKELYEKNHLHDIELFFTKDQSSISAHKIVLVTADKLKEHIEKASLNSGRELSSIELGSDYDSVVFAKVLKLMYVGKIKNMNISLLEARAMYRLACKIRARYVQRYIIIHLLLAQLNLEHCLYILEDAYSKLTSATVDETVKVLFELTKLYCARRFLELLKTQPKVVLKIDKYLLQQVVSKALYFITDEHQIKEYFKILMDRGLAHDVFDFSSKVSKQYKQAVAFDDQKIYLRELLSEISSAPLKFDLIKEDLNQGSKSTQYSTNNSKALTSIDDPVNVDLESKSPCENRVSTHNDITSKDSNLEIILQLQPNDFDKEGVTFFSE